MKFMDFIRQELVLVNMEPTTRDDVLAECVDALERAGVIKFEDRNLLLDSIIRREELGSNGIGNGDAIPHAKTHLVDTWSVVLCTSRLGIEWNSLDDKPVYRIFLILTSPDRPGNHLEILVCISRALRNSNFKNFLHQAETVEEVLDLLEEADNNQLG